MSWSSERAGPDQCYVCAACGKATAPGGKRSDLNDSACVIHAVLCWAQRKNARWQPVEAEPKP